MRDNRILYRMGLMPLKGGETLWFTRKFTMVEVIRIQRNFPNSTFITKVVDV